MTATFIINGKVRREYKKKLSEIKHFVKMFWYFEDIDRVMGGGLSDDDCDKILRINKTKIKLMENELLKQ